MRQNQRWASHLLDDIRHGECLSRTCDPQQHLILLLLLQTFDQFFDCLRLVTCRLELACQLKLGHDASMRFVRMVCFDVLSHTQNQVTSRPDLCFVLTMDNNYRQSIDSIRI